LYSASELKKGEAGVSYYAYPPKSIPACRLVIAAVVSPEHTAVSGDYYSTFKNAEGTPETL